MPFLRTRSFQFRTGSRWHSVPYRNRVRNSFIVHVGAFVKDSKLIISVLIHSGLSLRNIGNLKNLTNAGILIVFKQGVNECSDL